MIPVCCQIFESISTSLTLSQWDLDTQDRWQIFVLLGFNLYAWVRSYTGEDNLQESMKLNDAEQRSSCENLAPQRAELKRHSLSCHSFSAQISDINSTHLRPMSFNLQILLTGCKIYQLSHIH